MSDYENINKTLTKGMGAWKQGNGETGKQGSREAGKRGRE